MNDSITSNEDQNRRQHIINNQPHLQQVLAPGQMSMAPQGVEAQAPLIQIHPDQIINLPHSSLSTIEHGEFIYVNPDFLQDLKRNSEAKFNELKQEYEDVTSQQSKYLPRIFALKSDYDNCANFSQSTIKCLNEHHLQAIRGLLFNIMFIQFLMNLYVNYHYANMFDMFYYESEWGFIITMVHIGFSYLACQNKQWNKWAVVTAEVALGFDMIIEPLFWKAIAPNVFPDMGWNGIDLYWRIEMSLVHSLPLISMIIQIYMTDMVFLKKDWKMCFTAGLCYIFADWLGFKNEGHPMYPVVDWSSYPKTIGIFLIQAVILGLMEFLVASFLQWKRPDRDYKENIKE